ncbi:hypothetical protein CL618_01500 [archaeon]|nr:hypothetical protein [archaeon]
MSIYSVEDLNKVIERTGYGNPEANFPIVAISQAYFEPYNPDGTNFEQDRVLGEPCDRADLGTLVIALMPSGFLGRNIQRHERVLPFQINNDQTIDWVERYQDQELLHDFTQEPYTEALHKVAQTIQDYQEKLTDLKRIPDKQLIAVLKQITGEDSSVYLPRSIEERLKEKQESPLVPEPITA